VSMSVWHWCSSGIFLPFFFVMVVVVRGFGDMVWGDSIASLTVSSGFEVSKIECLGESLAVRFDFKRMGSW
jgi:hypothetical protein